ncbi:Uncharacterised protein [Vibrio cholerae]|nr:Uncharacterised protein [Vibrio cholerae]
MGCPLWLFLPHRRSYQTSRGYETALSRQSEPARYRPVIQSAVRCCSRLAWYRVAQPLFHDSPTEMRPRLSQRPSRNLLSRKPLHRHPEECDFQVGQE